MPANNQFNLRKPQYGDNQSSGCCSTTSLGRLSSCSTGNTHLVVQLATQGDNTYSGCTSDIVSWCPGFSGRPCPCADPRCAQPSTCRRQPWHTPVVHKQLALPMPAPATAGGMYCCWHAARCCAACGTPLPLCHARRCAPRAAQSHKHPQVHPLAPPCPTLHTSRHCMSSDYEPSSSSSYGGDIQSSSRRQGECAATLHSLLPAPPASLLPNMSWLPLMGQSCLAPTQQWCPAPSAAKQHTVLAAT